MDNRKTCIVIVGPTASGKTKLSIEIAKFFGAEIISADSRQCFKELNIGVAKPDESELQSIKHYFINSHSILEEVNAGVFEEYALSAAEEIFAKNDFAVVVGGTGLYIKAFCEGMDDMPEIDEECRQNLRLEYRQKGMEWLTAMIKLHDPLFYTKGEILNPHRMLRALEVKMTTGKSIMELHSSPKKQRPFQIIKTGIELPRQVLYEQINRRVDTMMTNGLLDEVTRLTAYRNMTALQTVGYKELFEYLDGKISLEQAVSDIKQNTRHYAKRQMTWFGRDNEINWFGNDKNKHVGYIIENTSLK
ncbi:MAG: tRNA (adenosine(37)-N6)-dimethylallyltransferase MiaA [Bacteroidetes bacterium]|nr:tRNA (adenosine(37)-N6)-dimethylallyltransferase MiaA [Bacteroidota bacterium]